MTKADPPLVVITRPEPPSYVAQTVYRGTQYTARRKARTTAVRAVARQVIKSLRQSTPQYSAPPAPVRGSD